MPQLALPFPDDDARFTYISETGPSPAELSLLREFDQEAELASLTPENRQRHFARIADEQRRAARESRRISH